jgi:hypothetical protein
MAGEVTREGFDRSDNFTTSLYTLQKHGDKNLSRRDLVCIKDGITSGND